MRFAVTARQMRSRVEVNWRNLVTVVLLGVAAAVSAAAGWDQHHHIQWLVAAGAIAALGGLTQVSWQARSRLSTDTTVRLGAWITEDKKGAEFAIFSRSAEKVELCLIGPGGDERRIALSRLRSVPAIWHGYVRGVTAGQQYGFRVTGDYSPEKGYRFNPAKLLLDPYARAIEGRVEWGGPVFGYKDDADGSVPDTRDSGRYVPHSVVVDTAFNWGNDHPPKTSWEKTVIYEMHVRGFTKRHPDVPDALLGTYAALGSKPVIDYLRALRVTTIRLMTVHHFVSERGLVERGLTNYWGYSPIGYFAPEASYSSSGTAGEQVREFKSMVRSLHANGFEVILDVVYNHTGEGNHEGPHLCFRGIDNQAYYRLRNDRRYYDDDSSGCGNSLNFSVSNPEVLDLIISNLRFWIKEMHVDGFFFNLVSALALNLYDDGQLGEFFRQLREDPDISRAKLIAESWDVGEGGGYQVDAFPGFWAEFNDDYRDVVRDFWRGTAQSRRGLARRLSGSADVCGVNERSPGTSVNFLTTHDSFTLHDLVSYNKKHNEANGKDETGVEDNRSWNCGVEGFTDIPAILRLREQQKRNFLTTLFLSAGVPLLYAGDELGHIQQGNNNAYCQDNEISYINWQLDERAEALLQFTRKLIELRADHQVFRRRKTFEGREISGSEVKDVGWFTADGKEMDSTKWSRPDIYALGMFLHGEAVFDRSTVSERRTDDSFLLLFNADSKRVLFTLPGRPWANRYKRVVDTSNGFVDLTYKEAKRYMTAGKAVQVKARSMLVLYAI